MKCLIQVQMHGQLLADIAEIECKIVESPQCFVPLNPILSSHLATNEHGHTAKTFSTQARITKLIRLRSLDALLRA